MSIEIQGVPESITRQQYINLVAGAGFNPAHVQSLEFRMDGIYAVVHALTEGGTVRTDAQGEAFLHRIFVPVKD